MKIANLPEHPAVAAYRFQWSYTKVSDYLGCPQKFLYKYVLKLPELKPGQSESPALTKGKRVHSLSEYFVKDLIADRKWAALPDELGQYQRAYRNLLGVVTDGGVVSAEGDWAFAADWANTGWFDANVWGRVKIDIYAQLGDVAWTVDVKTGRPRDGEYQQQLDSYALATFKRTPQVKTVLTEMWYVDHPPATGKTQIYTRAKDSHSLEVRFTNKLKAVQAGVDAKHYPPRPGEACTFCAYKASAGGPCRY